MLYSTGTRCEKFLRDFDVELRSEASQYLKRERKFVNAESSESKSQLDFEQCFGIGLYLVDDCSEIKPSIGKNDS